MIQTRSSRFGAAAAVVVALVLGLVVSLPSVARPGDASAQTVCEGQHFGSTCATVVSNAGVYCGGVFYAGEASCETIAGLSCGTAMYPYQTVCSTNAGITCGSVFYSYMTSCPETAGVTCNGTFYANTVVCPYTAGVNCNGTFYANTAACPYTTGVTCNGTFYANTAACPINFASTCANGAYPMANGECPSVYVTTVTPSTYVTSTLGAYSTTFAAGWDIVAGPTGTMISGNVGPLYAFRPGDINYEVLPQGTPLTAGMGYWAYFPTAVTESLPPTSGGSMTVSLPPGQFVMIGNGGDSPATVTGADVLLTFNTATNSYMQTSQLAPGQGAWALSWTGAQAAITNLPPFTSVP